MSSSTKLRAAIPVLLSAYLLAVALCSTEAHYDPLDVTFLAACYVSLGLALHLGTVGIGAIARPFGLLGALAVGCVAVWHVREQTWLPQARGAVLAAAAAAGFVYAACVWPALRRTSAARSLIGALIAGVALILLVGLGANASNTFRWHLLRHNKLLGTPFFLTVGKAVKQVESEIWDAHPSTAPPRPPTASHRPPSNPPNIVFVMIDTLRADSLAAYGGARGDMPNLDALARNSWVLEDVRANAPWTRASIASMLTGLLPEEHGAVNRSDRLSDQLTTLAERTRAGGYRNSAFVSNIAAVGREAGFAQGFDEFRELRVDGSPYARADAVVDAVLDWLRTNREPSVVEGGKPLFLSVHFLDPHTPYLSGGERSARHSVAFQAYRAELRFLDQHLGRLLEQLDTLLQGPTVLVVTSDHGEEFGEHDERGHGHSLYSEVLWIPSLVDLGDGSRGRIDVPLEGRDLFSLMMDASATDAFDIRSWTDANRRTSRSASVYLTTGDASWYRPYLGSVVMRSLERDGFRMIWSGYGDTHELYSIADDPAERVNRARRDEPESRRLKEALDDEIGWWAHRTPIEYSEATIEQLRALGYIVD